MGFKVFPSFLAGLLAILSLASCAVDYQTKAVDKARAYALDTLKGMDESQRDFIRYTDPVVMERDIYRLRGSNDLLHVCMVWTVPGLEPGLKVVVAGHAERSLFEWNPDGVVIERLDGPNKELNAATTKAVFFVMNRMLHLSDAERNNIRFSTPALYASKFDVEPEETKKKADEGKPLSRWEAYLKSKERKEKPVQYSFVWKAASGYVAVVGFSPKEGIARWNPVSGMMIDKAELDAMKLSGNLGAVVDYDSAKFSKLDNPRK